MKRFSKILILAILYCAGIQAQTRTVEVVKDGKVIFSSPADEIDDMRVTALNPPYNYHDYVDLGLPSGLKWATCNVGAETPEEYGNYYAWGETKPKKAYMKENSETYLVHLDELRARGIIGDDGNLTPEHDAASKNWGGAWRMPTMAEIEELIQYCTCAPDTINGVKGMNIISTVNGNRFFLPNAGCYHGGPLAGEGISASFDSSTPEERWTFAHGFYFYQGVQPAVGLSARYDGRTVRAVTK